MDDPILRATDPTGEVCDDPSEDALFMFIEDLEAPGSSVVVERLEPGQEGESARVTLQDNGPYRLNAGPVSTSETCASLMTF